MKCPACNVSEIFNLRDSADDYQDGYVSCAECGKDIATFDLDVEYKE